MDKYSVYKINKYIKSDICTVDDEVISEYPLTIYINDKEYITLLCTPEYLKELIVGYLKSDYLINTFNDIKSIVIDEEKGLAYVELYDVSILNDDLFRKRYITSGCSSSAVFYDTLDAIKLVKNQRSNKISIHSIFEMIRLLNQSSNLFKQTGGVHVAGSFEDIDNYLIIEDIGRHNAIDKLIGNALIKKENIGNKVIVVSGRISSEMILKCAKANINIVVSRSAPMDRAIDIAQKLNITLLGFVRGENANIYSGIERIEL